jgi:pyruvate-ferredoxin/flavodoxin oxidoreductase
MAGDGDRLPVSLLPADGTFPPGTTRYEKRSIAKQIPIWDPEICIQCGKCAIACPHATIRMKAYPPEHLEGAPPGFKHKDFRVREAPGLQQTVQVAPDDCTGCGVCVDVCPAKSKVEVRHKAINMLPADEHRREERENWAFFGSIPRTSRDLLPHDSVRGSQLLEPLFEFSGACAGCGETPYLKLLSQLFGDRMVVSDATGCSSIYSAALPTAAWTTDERGYGPAWNNPLFEDAAEFGLGLRLGYEAQRRLARGLTRRLAPELGEGLVRALLRAEQTDEPQIDEQRERVAQLLKRLESLAPTSADAAALSAVAGTLVRQSAWIVGGDGWAYDIGFGGLDHVRQRPRPRHGGLLQHRRPVVQGDLTRSGGQVRVAGQGDGQEGPGGHRPRLRQRLRRSSGDGRQRHPGDEGVRRGRCLARSFVDHRLQHLHRPRHRHVQVDDAPERRGAQRLLAAVPLPALRER